MKRIVPEPGPVRVLAASALINYIGNGFYLGLSVLFFTRTLGLSVEQVGAGLGTAAIISVLCVAQIGSLSDRLGSRQMYIWLQIVPGLMMILLAFAHTFPEFVVALTVATVAQRGSAPVVAALIAQISTPETRTQVRSYLLSVCNVGISVGLAFSGLVLAMNTRGWYVGFILANALSFFINAVILRWLPKSRRLSPQPRVRRAAALRDSPYMAVSALCGILSCQSDITMIALPLWIVNDTRAPRWTVSLLMFLSGILIATVQVRAARSVVNTTSASRASRRAGITFLFSCAAFAAATDRPVWVAFGVLLAALMVHTVGEAWFTAGTFELSHALAPDQARGQYQGAFNLASGVARSGSPILLTTLCLTWGAPGWLVLGAILALSGSAIPAVAAWAERSRREADAPSGDGLGLIPESSAARLDA